MRNQPRYIDCDQRTPEWFDARRGKPTGSRCADILAKRKDKKEAAPRAHYREQIVAEILTGVTARTIQTPEMRWGIEQERYARAAYELTLEIDVIVETCGFVIHPDLDRFGASPDLLVGSDGLAQFKCPNTTTHLAWREAGEIPLEHAPQLLAELACAADRKWIDFVSFDPRLPKHLQLFIRRMYRDERLIAALEAEVVKFNKEVDAMIAKLGVPAPAIAAPAPVTTPAIVTPAFPSDQKPTWDDAGPNGRRFANYAEYEAAKDEWLLRKMQTMLTQALTVPKGTVLH